MGGTFNPPHKAHIAMAKAAYEEYSLDKVMFMTGGNPPHKIAATDAKIRHHMMKMAISPYPEFEACDYEINKKSYSYTADTLKYLNEKYPDDSFYFIIGGDSFGAMFSWYKPEEILKRCTLLVYPREGYPNENDAKGFSEKYGARVFVLHAPQFDYSSTKIRQMVEQGKDLSEYIEPEVYEYIKRNSLYEKREESYEEHIKRLLKPDRYIHSLGVAATAVSMASRYGVDAKKAYIAGLLHDCAKNLSSDRVKIICRDLEVELDEYEKENPALIHAKVGAEFVKSEFGVNDPEICDAIRWHTLARPEMGELEKIIFVSDMIEPNRVYEEVEFLREVAFKNLDRGVFECISATIKFNEEKKKTVHPNAYATRDWLLKKVLRVKTLNI